MICQKTTCWKKLLLMAAGWALLTFAVNYGAFAVELEHKGDKANPAIVFVPGLASSGDLWADWAQQYAATHSVYVITAPGFAGVEARASKEAFLQTTVQEIAGELSSDGVSGAVVVGHSIGGLMSLMLASEHPDLVARALVVDSLPFLAGMFMPGTTPEAAKTQADFLGKQMASMPNAMFLAQQKQGLARLSNTSAFLPTLEKWSAESDQETVATAFSETLGLDYREELASVKADITVLAAHSKAMPIAKAQLQALFEAQYAALEQKEILMVDDSFHFIMIDQPEAFAKALGAVVEGE